MTLTTIILTGLWSAFCMIGAVMFLQWLEHRRRERQIWNPHTLVLEMTGWEKVCWQEMVAEMNENRPRPMMDAEALLTVAREQLRAREG